MSLLALEACSGGGGAGVPTVTLGSSGGSGQKVGSEGAPSPAPAAPQPAVEPVAADSVLDSIGVDTHFDYGETSYITNFSALSAALVASGIRHIRDGEPNDPHAQALAYLGQQGVKHSVSFPVTTTAAQITSTLEGYAPYVDYVEPQNEYDQTADTNSTWAASLVSEQKLLYATVRSNKAFAAVKVLGPSFAHAADAASVGPLDAYEDAGNLHDYPCNLNPDTTSSSGISATTALLRDSTQFKPIWTTEVGYADNMAEWPCALSDAVIAKFDPRTVAERWLAGEPRTYFYQFADMAPGENYNSMGLVTADGTPKPQYTALQSMAALLSDPGQAFQTSTLAYAIGGDTANVHQLLLEKRDGSYFLMLWLEVPGWNSVSGLPTTVAPQMVSLTFRKAPSSATQYSYASNWTLQSAPLASNTSLSISVTDAITFVRLRF